MDYFIDLILAGINQINRDRHKVVRVIDIEVKHLCIEIEAGKK